MGSERYETAIKEEREIAVGYLSNIDSSLYNTAFAFSNPPGGDVDICLVGPERRKIEQIPDSTDPKIYLHKFCLADFFKTVQKNYHPKEIRVFKGLDYLTTILKRKDIDVPVIDMTEPEKSGYPDPMKHC